MPRISIVIPVFNGWEQLTQCLDHLARSTYKNFETLVIDHGPEDSPRPTLLNSKETGLRIIRASTDLWWTGATNIGIRDALDQGDSKYIMLLNHDCFVEPDTIANLVEFTKTNDRAIVAPVQVDADTGEIKVRTAHTAFLLGFSTLIPPVRSTGRDPKPFIRTRMIVGGRGALIPGSAFNEVGLLDEESLPHYGSDNDFYLRCRKAGYGLWIATGSRVSIDSRNTTEASNVESLSLGQFFSTFRNRRSHRNIRDQVNLFRKHYPVPGLYFIGVFLNLARYTAIYMLARAIFVLKGFLADRRQ